MTSHNITPSDRLYDDVKQKQATCALHDAAKNGRDHHDAVNRIEIRLKTRYYAIPISRFVVEHTIEGVLVCDAS